MRQRGKPLPKRRAREGIIGVGELRRIHSLSDASHGGVPVVAVSHVWRTRRHPDPTGETLAMVIDARSRVCGLRCAAAASPTSACSSIGARCRRSRARWIRRDSTRKGTRRAAVWYGSALTTVLLATPASAPDGSTFAQRGWPSFERALASLVKPSNLALTTSDWPRLLDLGLAHPEAAAREPLPPSLGAFCAGHEPYGELTYTDAADRDSVVAPAFELALEEVLGSAESLQYDSVGWGAAQTATLAMAVPLLGRVIDLRLTNNGFGDDGCGATGARASRRRPSQRRTPPPRRQRHRRRGGGGARRRPRPRRPRSPRYTST